jgi:hypothetical protein
VINFTHRGLGRDKLPVNAPFWGHRLCLFLGSSLRGVTLGKKQIKLEDQNNRKTVGFFLRVTNSKDR